MVVEDEVTIAMELGELLKTAGYQVVGFATSGEEAIEMAKALAPDLILMDIVMPGRLDGIAAAEIINAELDTPVLFLTAHADDELIQRAKGTEAFGYIMKPFREAEIKANIELALSKKKMERMLRDSTAQISSSLQEKEILLTEIHQRLQNNMQVIYGLLGVQVGKVSHQRLSKIINDCQKRIRSMALGQNKSSWPEDLGKINFALYIKEQSLLVAYESRGRIALKLDLEEVWLSIDAAIPCGLIFDELMSNALKHSFPGSLKGELRIALASDDSGRITLMVSNNGVDFPADLHLQNTPTFGLQLVNILTQQLNGTLELDRSIGTTFRMTFKPCTIG
jgi:two-component sensor histidine kinase